LVDDYGDLAHVVVDHVGPMAPSVSVRSVMPIDMNTHQIVSVRNVDVNVHHVEPINTNVIVNDAVPISTIISQVVDVGNVKRFTRPISIKRKMVVESRCVEPYLNRVTKGCRPSWSTGVPIKCKMQNALGK
jgi:hypothetical protein